MSSANALTGILLEELKLIFIHNFLFYLKMNFINYDLFFTLHHLIIELKFEMHVFL